MLERERELAELGAAAKEAKSGAGSVVLIVGEAGIGKSSLVKAIRSVLPAEGRLLVGYCDDLATPRGPRPVARSLDGIYDLRPTSTADSQLRIGSTSADGCVGPWCTARLTATILCALSAKDAPVPGLRG